MNQQLFNAFNYPGYYGYSGDAGDSGPRKASVMPPYSHRSQGKRTWDQGETFDYTSSEGPFGKKRNLGIFEGSPLENDVGFGFQTNPTVNYPIATKPVAEDLLYPPQMYDILIVKRITRFDRKTFSINGGMSALTAAFNPVIWNYVQHLGEKAIGPNDIPLTAAEVLRKWEFGGIVRAEIGAEGEKPSTQQTDDRAFSCTIYGFTNTFQRFGDNVDCTTKLGFILKKVNRTDGRYILDANRGDVKIVSGIGTLRTHLPFQLVPWADFGNDFPTERDLCYVDEHGKECRGAFIEIGLSQSPVRTGLTRPGGSMETNLRAVLSQPQISMLVVPRTMVF
jgi:hypothetical protein